MIVQMCAWCLLLLVVSGGWCTWRVLFSSFSLFLSAVNVSLIKSRYYVDRAWTDAATENLGMQILTTRRDQPFSRRQGRVSPCPSRYSHILTAQKPKPYVKHTHTCATRVSQTAHGHLGNSLTGHSHSCTATGLSHWTSTRHVPGCTLHFTLTTHCPRKHRMHSSPRLRTVSNRITSLLSTQTVSQLPYIHRGGCTAPTIRRQQCVSKSAARPPMGQIIHTLAALPGTHPRRPSPGPTRGGPPRDPPEERGAHHARTPVTIVVCMLPIRTPKWQLNLWGKAPARGPGKCRHLPAALALLSFRPYE